MPQCSASLILLWRSISTYIRDSNTFLYSMPSGVAWMQSGLAVNHGALLPREEKKTKKKKQHKINSDIFTHITAWLSYRTQEGFVSFRGTCEHSDVGIFFFFSLWGFWMREETKGTPSLPRAYDLPSPLSPLRHGTGWRLGLYVCKWGLERDIVCLCMGA